jgi:hypothetical protein
MQVLRRPWGRRVTPSPFLKKRNVCHAQPTLALRRLNAVLGLTGCFTPEQRAPMDFTFFWTKTGHWEGRDFQVGIDMGGEGA